MDLHLLIFLIVVFLVGTPFGISYLLYKWIKKKEFNPRFRLVAIIPVLVVLYFIYDAIYPSVNFYKTDFKEVTSMEFPEEGIIIYKSASFPDQFGDYTSSFLVEFEKDYLIKLETNLKNQGFEKTKNNISSDELNYIEHKMKKKKYSTEYAKEIDGGKYFSVGFLDDNKSVIITRVSW